MRFGAAALALAAIATALRIRWPARSDWWRVVLVGMLAVPVYHIPFNHGMQTVSAGAAAVMNATSPIWTTLIGSVLLREETRPRTWAGLVLSLSGVVIIARAQGGALTWSPGAFLILLAAIAQACAFVLQVPLVRAYGAFSTTVAITFAGTAVLATLYGTTVVAAVRDAGSDSIVAAVYLGLVSSAGAQWLWGFVLGRAPVTAVAPFLLLVPVAAAIIARPLLGEMPDRLTIVGAAVVLTGVVLSQLPLWVRHRRIG